MEAELFGHERACSPTPSRPLAAPCSSMRSANSPLVASQIPPRVEDQVIRRVGGFRDTRVHVQVIAASNRDLEKAEREGQFRQDLHYRLAIIAILIAPLRDRKEDIMPLVDFFIDRHNRRFKKSVRRIFEETRRLILALNWPGNVREPKNTLERGMIRRRTGPAPAVSAVLCRPVRWTHGLMLPNDRKPPPF
jgi:hypothetical protein